MTRNATIGSAACTAMIAASLFAIPAAGALDDAVSTGIVWTCSQERDAYFHVSCVPQRSRPDNAAATETMREPAPSRGDAAPRESVPAFRGHDMRPVTTRGDAEVFSTRAWRIPLYSQPANPAAIAGLLESVLCGTASQCSVSYEGGQPAR